LLAKQAKEAGAHEAWFIDPDGSVKEGAATNAWIVSKDGKLVTRPSRERHLARHHPQRLS
jgi:D-alanine transaminase